MEDDLPAPKRRRLGNLPDEDPLNLASLPQSRNTLLTYLQGCYARVETTAEAQVKEMFSLLGSSQPEIGENPSLSLLYACDSLPTPKGLKPSHEREAPRFASIDNLKRNLVAYNPSLTPRRTPCIQGDACLFGTICKRLGHPMDKTGVCRGVSYLHEGEAESNTMCLVDLLYWMSNAAHSAQSVSRSMAQTINPIRVTVGEPNSISEEHLLFHPLIEGAVPVFTISSFTAGVLEDGATIPRVYEGRAHGPRDTAALCPKWRLFRKGSRLPTLMEALGSRLVIEDLPDTAMLLPSFMGSQTNKWCLLPTWSEIHAWVKETGYPAPFLDDPVVQNHVLLFPLVTLRPPETSITERHPFFSVMTGNRPDAIKAASQSPHPLPASNPDVCKQYSLYWAVIGMLNTLMSMLAIHMTPGTRHHDFIMERAESLSPLLSELSRVMDGRPPSDAELEAIWGTPLPNHLYPNLPCHSCDTCCGSLEREILSPQVNVYLCAHMPTLPHDGLPDLGYALQVLLAPDYTSCGKADEFKLAVTRPAFLSHETVSPKALAAGLLAYLEDPSKSDLEQRYPLFCQRLVSAAHNEGDTPSLFTAILFYLQRIVSERPLLLPLIQQNYLMLSGLLRDPKASQDLPVKRVTHPFHHMRDFTTDLGRCVLEIKSMARIRSLEEKGKVPNNMIWEAARTGRLYRWLVDSCSAPWDPVELYSLLIGLLKLLDHDSDLLEYFYQTSVRSLLGTWNPGDLDASDEAIRVVSLYTKGLPYMAMLRLRLALEYCSGELNKCLIRLQRKETVIEQQGEFTHRGLAGITPTMMYARDHLNRCTEFYLCPATLDARGRRQGHRGSKMVMYDAETDTLLSEVVKSQGKPTNRIITRNLEFNVTDEFYLPGHILLFPHGPVAFRGRSGTEGKEYNTLKMYYNRHKEVIKRARNGHQFSVFTGHIPAPPPLVKGDGDLRVLVKNLMHAAYCCAECGALSDFGQGTYACSEGPWCRLCPLAKSQRAYYRRCIGCQSLVYSRANPDLDTPPSLRRNSTNTSNRAKKAKEKRVKKNQVQFDEDVFGLDKKRDDKFVWPAREPSLYYKSSDPGNDGVPKDKQMWAGALFKQKRINNIALPSQKYKETKAHLTAYDLATGDWHHLHVCVDCERVEVFSEMLRLDGTLTLDMVRLVLTKRGALKAFQQTN